MSTKQLAVNVVSRSNQQSSLSLLRPPLVQAIHRAFHEVNLQTSVANMKRSISEESFERVFLYTHLSQFGCNQIRF